MQVIEVSLSGAAPSSGTVEVEKHQSGIFRNFDAAFEQLPVSCSSLAGGNEGLYPFFTDSTGYSYTDNVKF